MTDLPGLGEDPSHAASYGLIHQDRLLTSDCFLYLLKTDDRAYEVDLAALSKISEASRIKLWLGISQADRAEPWKEWLLGDAQGRPGPQQHENLVKKKKEVAKIFRVKAERILAFSAHQNFGLSTLLMSLLKGALFGP